MQIRENRCDVAEPRFLGDYYPNKSVLDTLKASQIRNGCASQERIAEIKSGANYCCRYGFGSMKFFVGRWSRELKIETIQRISFRMEENSY